MQESLNEKVQLLFSGSQLRGSSRSAECAHGPAELTAGAKTDPADSAEMPELKSKLAGHAKENRLAYLLSEEAIGPPGFQKVGNIFWGFEPLTSFSTVYLQVV